MNNSFEDFRDYTPMVDTVSLLGEPNMQEQSSRRMRFGRLILAGLLVSLGCGVLYFDPWRSPGAAFDSPITMIEFATPKKTPAQTGLGTMQVGAYKAGLSHFMMEDGTVVPGTVLYVGDGAKITARRTEKVRYQIGDQAHYQDIDRLQLGYQPCYDKNLKFSQRVHLRKAGCPPLRKLFQTNVNPSFEGKPGDSFTYLELFKPGDKVSVTGTSIGKGFQGGIKRWNMHRGLMTHGSKSHRGPGSIGMRYSGGGGRVMPGVRMPGRMGNKRVTMKTDVVDVDLENQALILKGSLPGHSGSFIKVKGSGLPDDGVPKGLNGRACGHSCGPPRSLAKTPQGFK